MCRYGLQTEGNDRKRKQTNKIKKDMKCGECKYWVKSKVYGNHCSFCGGLKPCDAERRKKADKSRKRRHKKMDAYDKGSRKIRYTSGGEEWF